MRGRLAITMQPSSALNINTYQGNGLVLATLIRGGAAAKTDTAEKKFQFVDGQQAVIINDSLALIRNVDGNEIAGWKNGELYYKEATLQTIMPAIAKWYDVDIRYAGKVSDKKFTLRVPRSAPLTEVLDNLKKQGLRITQQGKTFTIWN